MSCSLPVRALLVACALCGGVCWAQSTGEPGPGSPDWLERQFGYVANNESLRSLLYDFGTTLGVPVIVSARIDDIADDEVPVTSAERFLAEIHTRFGLIWVYDGTTLYLYDDTEAVSETVALPFAMRDAFKATVEATGIKGVPLNWIFLPAESALQLSGPPRFVDWAKEVAEDLADTEGPLGPGDDRSFAIRIFEVQYGYVDQTANSASGGKAPITSLAEMVAKLMNVAHVSGIVPAGAAPNATGTVPKLRGTGIIPSDGASDPSPAPSPGVVPSRQAGEEAFVIGDPRLNAIIVRDHADRMPTYERLIAALDSPVDQVEIAISVLDIDASAADELRFAFESDSFQINAGADDDGNSIYYSESLWDVEGIALRVRALRNSGRSRILTRPSVTTLDNHEASFQNNRTFYVRLGGNDAESVDLAPVSYGWLVRIRPHVIHDEDHKRVQLAIHIEDGNRGGAALEVTGVPEVAQNVIQTQAVVREGNSLLIGGYTVREQTRFRQRIPLLGRIPLMGRLFSTRVDRDQSVARYFLITPRILPASISYEINTGFEGEPLDGVDTVIPVSPARDETVQPTVRPTPAAEQLRPASPPDAKPVGEGEPHFVPESASALAWNRVSIPRPIRDGAAPPVLQVALVDAGPK
ncbi:MAG: hypothetical protein F4X99_21455 [Gammaproteobacteria bacterium]|nr:hypothetical protein [Gammaproteobacteria bacterium]